MKKSEIVRKLNKWAEYEFGQEFIDLVLSHFRKATVYPENIDQKDLCHLYGLEVLYRVYSDCGGLND